MLLAKVASTSTEFCDRNKTYKQINTYLFNNQHMLRTAISDTVNLNLKTKETLQSVKKEKKKRKKKYAPQRRWYEQHDK